MAKPDESYRRVIVETYSGRKPGKSSLIHVRPVAGQDLDTAMDVECRRDMRKEYPVGTRFRIKAKLTDREGGKPFLWSHHSWTYEVLD